MRTGIPRDNQVACAFCHWWESGNSVNGHCKRMPPAAHFESGHYWPMTGRSDMCGEFRPIKGYEHIKA